MTDWDTCLAVERRPGKLGGVWTFAGTRVPVLALFENLGSGATIEEFLDWFPGVEEWKVRAVLEHEVKSAQNPSATVRILFDQGTPAPLRRHLDDHLVHTASEMGWSDLDNGDLLDKAEREDYQVLITTDQNMRYQQNLSGRRLAIIVLLSTAWPKIQLRIADIRAALDEIRPGELKEVPI